MGWLGFLSKIRKLTTFLLKEEQQNKTYNLASQLTSATVKDPAQYLLFVSSSLHNWLKPAWDLLLPLAWYLLLFLCLDFFCRPFNLLSVMLFSSRPLLEGKMIRRPWSWIVLLFVCFEYIVQSSVYFGLGPEKLHLSVVQSSRDSGENTNLTQILSNCTLNN